MRRAASLRARARQLRKIATFMTFLCRALRDHLASLWASGELSRGYPTFSVTARRPMLPELDSEETCRRRLHEWLLLLLRFAVTRDPADRSAALAMADELDSLGMRWRPAGPRFFLQTSDEVCDAVLASGEWRMAALRKHAARI